MGEVPQPHPARHPLLRLRTDFSSARHARVVRAAQTFVVGEVDEGSKKLVKCAHDCLMKAIAMCKPGVRYRDVGDVITKHASSCG